MADRTPILRINFWGNRQHSNSGGHFDSSSGSIWNDVMDKKQRANGPRFAWRRIIRGLIVPGYVRIDSDLGWRMLGFKFNRLFFQGYLSCPARIPRCFSGISLSNSLVNYLVHGSVEIPVGVFQGVPRDFRGLGAGFSRYAHLTQLLPIDISDQNVNDHRRDPDPNEPIFRDSNIMLKIIGIALLPGGGIVEWSAWWLLISARISSGFNERVAILGGFFIWHGINFLLIDGA